MPAAYTLEWRDGRTLDLFGHRGYYYVFPDQVILAYLPNPAWCRHCEQITLCEHLETEAKIRKELADLADPTSERSLQLARISTPGFSDTWRRTLEVRLRHALLRRLPASCLACGHRDVAYFTEGEWAPHPGTSEEVHFYCTGMCSTDFARKFYDVDCSTLDLSADAEKALWEAIRDGKAF